MKFSWGEVDPDLIVKVVTVFLILVGGKWAKTAKNQLTGNGGSSMKDAVDRIEKNQTDQHAENTRRLGNIDTRITGLDTRVTAVESRASRREKE